MSKTRNVNLGAAGPSQPNQGGLIKAAPYYRMTKAKERRATKAGQLIYRMEKELAAPAADRLLVRYGLLSTGVEIDFQMTMDLIKKLKTTRPRILGSYMTFNMLQLISNARNEADHDDLVALISNETGNFSVLRDFCGSLGDTNAAIEAQRLMNHAQNDDWQSALTFHFWFTDVYNDHVAHCLCMIVYAVIIIYLAVSLYEFRLTRYPLAIEPPPIDAYSNLKFFKQEQKKNVNYFGPGGDRRRDRELLKECLNARKQNRHSGHKETFSGWVSQLDDIIRLLDVMKFGFRARAVESIRDTLIVARRRGTIVSSTLFPSLFN